MSEAVNHPKHYTQHPSGVECIQISEHMNFCLGNALKYIWRADLKDDAIEDLEKANWYLRREIRRRKQEPVLQFWSNDGALLCNREIRGLTQRIDGDTAKRYGGHYFIGETITRSAARLLAPLLDGEYLEQAPLYESLY